MKFDIIISINENIKDPLTMGQTHVVSEIFRIASGVLASGGKVIVQREYSNAKPDRLCVFDKQADLDAWKERLNDVQIKLGQDKID